MLFSAYLLFTLPHNLVMKGGLPTLELGLGRYSLIYFVSVGLTFILGIAAVNNAMQSGRENGCFTSRRKKRRSGNGRGKKSDDGVAGGVE